MGIQTILVAIYIAIGIILMLYWDNKEYANSYKKTKSEGEVEKGMISILFLFLVFFWPIKLIINLIRKKRI